MCFASGFVKLVVTAHCPALPARFPEQKNSQEILVRRDGREFHAELRVLRKILGVLGLGRSALDP